MTHAAELNSLLSRGFVEGEYSYLSDEDIRDNLQLARDPRRLSPHQMLQSLQQRGLIEMGKASPFEQFVSQGKREIVLQSFPDWSKEEMDRFAAAKEMTGIENAVVVTRFGRLRNPDNLSETRKVMFIAAGGREKGMITAGGVIQMRKAMEVAQEQNVPIVFLNAILSADPSFGSEVGQISRQISDTMTLGLRLTVPKITVVTGEAASAGAHSAWQIADRTLIFDKGALLTVIIIEEALQLLRFGPEITQEANVSFLRYLKDQGMERISQEILSLIQGIETIERILFETDNTQRILENEDNLVSIVSLAKEVHPQSDEKVMLIMPADNFRFVSGMLSRGADMVTIHADDWQKKAERDTTLTKADFIAGVKQAMKQARERETSNRTDVYFRLNAAGFEGFWKIDDVKKILRELHSEGLTGIRFTEAVSSSELIRLSWAMQEVEEEMNLSLGTFRICLSVEDDQAINSLEQVIQEGDVNHRLSAVVMGVRDYTKSMQGVAERDWSHGLVIEAKQRLAEQIDKFKKGGWNNLQVLHAVASYHNDFEAVHQEAVSSKVSGVDGMLVVSPQQIPHIRASFEGLFDEKGQVNIARITDIRDTAKERIGLLLSGIRADSLLYTYHQLLYQIYHRYRLDLLRAGGAFPEELLQAGIVDEIIYSRDESYEHALVKTLWNNLTVLGKMTQAEVRAERLAKLVKLGATAVLQVKPISLEIRRKKAEGREQRAAQYWLDLITDGRGFEEEILTDLEPDTSMDILAKVGREGIRTYEGQVKESQEKTGTLAGIIAGYIKTCDINVLLIVRDQDFINATAGASTGEIVRRACFDAVRRKKNGETPEIAICYIDVSAGGRVQEGALALAPSELAVAGLVEAQEVGIPIINVGHTYILGSDGIGPFYCADKVVLIGGSTELGLAGRRIVERSSPRGKNEFPPGFRLASYHQTVGNIDALLEKPEDLLPYLEKELRK